MSVAIEAMAKELNRAFRGGHVEDGLGPVLGQALVIGQGETLFGQERTQDQGPQGSAQEQGHEDEVGPDQGLFQSGLGLAPDVAQDFRHQGDGGLAFVSGVEGHEAEGEQDLDQGEGCGQGQVEKLDRLTVDLHLHRGQSGAAQDEDNAETGEAEDKDQQGGGQDGGGPGGAG